MPPGIDSPAVLASIASSVLGAFSVKNDSEICRYPLRTTSQMISSSGTAVSSENPQTT